MRYGLNVSDEGLAERLRRRQAELAEDEALRKCQEGHPERALESVAYVTTPFHDVFTDGDVFTYKAETAARRGWPVGGRVRWVAAHFEVV